MRTPGVLVSTLSGTVLTVFVLETHEGSAVQATPCKQGVCATAHANYRLCRSNGVQHRINCGRRAWLEASAHVLDCTRFGGRSPQSSCECNTRTWKTDRLPLLVSLAARLRESSRSTPIDASRPQMPNASGGARHPCLPAFAAYIHPTSGRRALNRIYCAVVVLPVPYPFSPGFARRPSV